MAIDRAKLNEILPRLTNGAPASGEAPLADLLRSPHFNREERNEVVRVLANDPRATLLFYANDYPRTINDNPKEIASLREDQRVIGEALQQAFKDKVIGTDDLVRIATVKSGFHSEQRFMTVLRNGGGGTDGTVAALSDVMWKRAEILSAMPGAKPEQIQRDRAVAAIGYLSDPDLQAARLGKPEPNTAVNPTQSENRRLLFETLSSHGEMLAKAKDGVFVSESQFREMGREAAIANGQLYVSHSKQLTDRYTGELLQTDTLAKFYKQSMFNPDTHESKLPGGKPLADTVASAVQGVSNGYLDAAKAAPKGSDTQKAEMGKLGFMTAGVEGGITLALKEYTDKITAHEKDRDAFAKTLGTVIGAVPVPGGKAVGGAVKAGTDPGLKALYEFMVDPPPQPDLRLGDAVKDTFERRAVGVSQDAVESFRNARSDELHDLYRHFNINPGGYRPVDGPRADASPLGDHSTALASAGPDQLFDRLVAAQKSGDPVTMDRALNQAASAEINRDVREQAVASVDAKQQAAVDAQQRGDQSQTEERSRGPRIG
ncbi:hypothetical protein [Lysobacter sp. CA199]|uniref:hypothetical protein n=1 Tax=Lysobacter sp. CA199 TaxID=3455608 RepID=UPI003F8D002F